MALEDWSTLRIVLFVTGFALTLLGFVSILISVDKFPVLNNIVTRSIARFVGVLMIFASFTIPDKNTPTTTPSTPSS
jgi:hypothetical protein